jgi:hypothetical protein
VADYLDNPAGRLQQIFEAMGAINANQLTWIAWRDSLDLPDADEIEVATAIIALKGQIDEAERLLRATSDDETFAQYSGWIGHARAAVSSSLGAWQTPLIHGVSPHLSPTMQTELRLCSFQLHRSSRQVVPSDDEVSSIAESVDSLLDDVRASDLPFRLRTFLEDHLIDMQRTLELVRLEGVTGLEQALDRGVGGYIRLASSETIADDAQPFMQRFRDCLQVIGLAVQAVGLVAQLTAASSQPLQLPPAPAPTVIVVDASPPEPPAIST